MKRILVLFFAAVLVLFGLFACDKTTAYLLDDFIPPLMDKETQYPYVTEITVTDIATGEIKTFTDGTDHNRIRMIFEELECVRTKAEAEVVAGYAVTFVTTEESVTITIPMAESYLARYVYIGEYEFEILRSGVDTAYFTSLFAK